MEKATLPPLLSHDSIPIAGSAVSSPAMSSSTTPSPILRPTNLDELLDDCFQLHIGQKDALCETRTRYATSFDKFLTSLHCHENLAFLMEIFKYEYFFGKVFPESFSRKHEAADVMSSSMLNSSLSSTIDSLPFPTRVMSKSSRRQSRSRSRTPLFLGGRPPLSVFDAEFEENFDTENVWDKLKDQHIDSDLDLDLDLDLEWESDGDHNKLLSDQWAYIMSQFVLEDAPQQLNLANSTVKDLIEKDSQDCIKNPAVLLPAKDEIIQLLRENVYGTFLSQHKSRNASNATSAACSASASRSHSRAQSPHPEEAGFICTAANCCLPTASKLFSHTNLAPVSLGQSPAQTPLARNTPKCHSPSPLHQSTARQIPGALTKAESEVDLLHEVLSPVPLVKRKTPKFFPHIGNSNTPTDSSGSEFSLSSIMSHFKTNPASPSNTPQRNLASPAPKTASAIASELSLPLLSDNDLRPVSTGEGNSQSHSHLYRFGKIWRRRK